MVEQHGALSVKGNRIVDQAGKPVILRGMALYWSQWKGQFYNPSAVKWLVQDWKCTVIRASMAVENGGYLTNPEAEKKKVMTVVQTAIDLGIYVIVDWHDHNAYAHTAQSKAFFEEMARTYGKYPNVLYELYNEPLNTHTWAGQIKPYHEAVIPSIRAQDPDNIIICGTRSWSQDVDEASKNPIAGTNIAYTLHFYAATHKQSLRDKAATALKNGIALVVTEWGAGEANGSGFLDEPETRRWWDFMDQNQLSHANWSVADLTETTAALRPGANAMGGWSTADLSASGKLIRDELRLKFAAGEATALFPAKGGRNGSSPGITTIPTSMQGSGWTWTAPIREGTMTGFRDLNGRHLAILPLPALQAEGAKP
jgi:endoglucanase